MLIAVVFLIASAYLIGTTLYAKFDGKLTPYEREWCKEFRPDLWADECRSYLDGDDR